MSGVEGPSGGVGERRCAPIMINAPHPRDYPPPHAAAPAPTRDLYLLLEAAAEFWSKYSTGCGFNVDQSGRLVTSAARGEGAELARGSF